MNEKTGTPEIPCSEVRAELLSLLYGEVELTRAQAIERHLAGCEACAREWHSLRGVSDLLSRWQLPESALAGAHEDETAGLAQSILERGVRRRRAARLALRPALVGLAAACVVFVTLSVFGGRVRYVGGELTFSLRAPWTETVPAGDDVSLAALEPRLRDIALHELAGLEARLEESHAHRLHDWSRFERERRLELVKTIDRTLIRDRATIAAWLKTLSAGTARESRRTQEALVDLAAYVAEGTSR